MAALVTRLHHVQVAMPPDGEAAATAFYAGVLGLEEVPKPPALARFGGCWFRGGGVELHLGVERPFAPARKAHPALVVASLEEARRRLAAAGAPIAEADEAIAGHTRFYTEDPFGNRIELLAPREEEATAPG